MAGDEVLDWAIAQPGEVALATVVATWGSSPRPVGSCLAVGQDGHFVGSVSGGCVEAAVVSEAQSMLATGAPPQILEFGVSDAMAWEVGLACGGRIKLWVARIGARQILEGLVAKIQAGEPVACVRNLTDGSACLVTPQGVSGPLTLAPDQLAGARQMLAQDRCGMMGEVFVQVYAPLHQLVIIGAVHIAQALVTMAQALDYAIHIIDPRQAFGALARFSPERFPGVILHNAWPDAAMAGLLLDARTALVTLTHDPKLDDPALLAGLASDAFFIGALGSRKTHAARCERLAGHGVTAAQCARIKGPVGLAIGALTQGEIGLSILAQITAARRLGEG